MAVIVCVSQGKEFIEELLRDLVEESSELIIYFMYESRFNM